MLKNVLFVVFMLTGCEAFSQSPAVQVCVTQAGGAVRLAAWLSTRRLVDGSPMTAVSAPSSRNATTEMERQACDLAIEKRRHDAELEKSQSATSHSSAEQVQPRQEPWVMNCVGCVFLFTWSHPFASHAMNVCIVQENLGIGGSDFAAEMAKQKLLDGTPITAVLTTKKGKEASADIERQECDYAVRFSRHESADNFDTNPPPGIPSSYPGAPPSPAPMRDRETVDYELTKPNVKKVIARGSAPPVTVYVRQNRRLFNPYPILAAQIVEKINKSR